MKKNVFKRGALVAAAISVVLVGGGALAWGQIAAAIPGPDGLIHTCYPTREKTKPLRVIDPATGGACTDNETALDINQAGPTAYYAKATVVGINDGRAPVLSKNVPAGNYAINATIYLANNDLNNVAVPRCLLFAGTEFLDDVVAGLAVQQFPAVYPAAGSTEAVAMQGVVSDFAGGDLTIKCGDAGTDESVVVAAKLTATKVAEIR